MSYAECRDGVKTILQALTGTFTNTWQVTAGDYQVLDKGLPPTKPYAAVLTAGSFDSDEAIYYQSTKHWDVMIDLFVRYTTSEETNSRFDSTRDAVIGQLDKYPSLNNVSGVTNVVVSASGDPVQINHKAVSGSVETGPTFMVQTLRVNVTQRVALSGGEYT
jgi:hypothetical protein